MAVAARGSRRAGMEAVEEGVSVHFLAPTSEGSKLLADLVRENKERKARMASGAVKQRQPSKVDPSIEYAELEKHRIERRQLADAARKKLKEFEEAAQKAANDLQGFKEWMATQGLTVSMDRWIIRIVAEHFNVTPDELVGPSRTIKLMVPRHVAMYLVRQLTTLSFPQISARLGRKDHTTAWHAIDNITRKISADEEFRATVELLRDKINPPPAPLAMAAE